MGTFSLQDLNAITIALIAVSVIAIVLIVVLWIRQSRLFKFHSGLAEGAARIDLADVLGKQEEEIRRLFSLSKMQDERERELDGRLRGAIQRVGLVKFDAFQDVGGELSFALALLDDRGNGIVISNLYARAESTVYIKDVTQGVSSKELTPEEKEAVARAIART